MADESGKETAKQVELERRAREAYAEAATEKAKREAAEQAARQALAKAEAEQEKREAAEQSAQQALSKASSSQSAREAAEKAAVEANTRADSERSARQAAESKLNEISTAVARAMPSSPATATVNASAPAPTTAPVPAAAPSTLATAPQASPASSTATTGDKEKIRNWLIPLVIFAAAGFMFFIVASGWTSWENNVSVKTDDAYVKADVAPLSTKASGVVLDTKVNDFQSVKAGQILVELKNDEYKARVEQAREAINQVEIKIADMKQRKELQDARVSQARLALENSQTGIAQADDTMHGAVASLDEAGAGIDGANASILQGDAAVKAASADVTRASLERTRQEALLANESATREKVELAVNEHERAVANLEAQKAARSKARAELAQRKAQVVKATQLLSSSRSEKTKSALLVDSRQAELTAQIKQRELLDGEEKQLLSELAVKKAGLTSANVDLDYTTVKAPTDGIVGELKVKPGQLVNAGTQVVTIISAEPWVLANYRETQLTKVKDGDHVAVTIDALPGAHFSGHVERISPASGAQFSLLPPDNASGNFTKVTQRIPVKICFDEDKQKLANLRPGMSVTVTIMPGTSGANGK